MPEPSHPVQFFAGSPRLHQLTTLLVVFEKPGDQAPGKQVLRCRELIFRCTAVLASPSDDAASVLVLVPRAFNLLQTLADMRARVLAERPASRDDFACCLRYTLRAKLAPQWNVVGELLLQGREFLQVTGPINAVRLQVTVTDEDICLSTQACVVRLPRLSLNDLGASPDALGDFHAGLSDVISERQLTGRWCHILPRMTKGQVATVTRQLLPSGPFAAYRDLKRHWKNNYGYRLPDEAPSYYVNVNFRLVGPQLFTYPPACLRNGPPVHLARPAPRPILTALLRDLHVKVGSVCGQPLTFSGTPSYLTVQLQPAPTFQRDVRPNLSSVPTTRQPPAATRHVGQVPAAAPAAAVRPGLPPQQTTASPAPPQPPPQQRQQQTSRQPQQQQQQQHHHEQQPSPLKRRRQQQQQPGADQTSSSTPGSHPPLPGAPPPATSAAGRGPRTPTACTIGTSPRHPPAASRPPPVRASAAPSTAAVGAVPPPPAALSSVPTAAGRPGSRPGPVPRSPMPGHLASCPASLSNTGNSAGAAAAPCSPRPARIVPVFKPRSAAAARPLASGRAPAVPRQAGAAGKRVSTKPAAAGGAAALSQSLAVGRTAGAAAASKAKAVERLTGADNRQTQAAAAQPKSSQGTGGRQDVPALCRRGQLHRASIATLAEWLRERGRSCAGRPSKAQLITQVQESLRGELTVPSAGAPRLD